MVRFGVVFFSLASSGSVKPPDAGNLVWKEIKIWGVGKGGLERDRRGGVCVFIIYRLYALVSTSSSQNKKKIKTKKENVCPSIHYYSLFPPGGYIIKPGHFSYASLSRENLFLSFSS